MRRRPCACGCNPCDGYACSASIDGVICPSVDDILYSNFHEQFNQSGLVDGWTNENFSIYNNRGTHTSGNYTQDTVIGTGLRDPLRCSYFHIGSTFYYQSATDGAGTLSLGGGPSLSLSNKEVYLTLPNGSSIQIDKNFTTGNHYGVDLYITKKPQGYYNELTITKYKNTESIENSWCDTSQVSGTPHSPATNGHTVPYSGCEYSYCNLFSSGFQEPADDVYTITDPPTLSVSISGNWQIDDVCFLGTETKPQSFVGYGNNEDCSVSCDYIMRPMSLSWTLPCTSGEGVSVVQSGTVPYLVWEAWDDRYLLDTDDFRCGIIPTASSQKVYLRTTLKQYETNLLSADIWSIYPHSIKHTYDCSDSTPFDEFSDCLIMEFSGYPCIEQCYGPPFGAIDSITTLGGNGNVCYDLITNCLQAGNNGFSYPLRSGETVYNRSMDDPTIPRDDRYSAGRQYVAFGEYCTRIDDSLASFYSVDKRGYRINWDADNEWWYGQFQFLNASGGVIGTAGGSGSPTNYNNFDCSLIYKSGVCETYDMYIYALCDANLNSGGGIIDLLDSGGNLYSTATFSESTDSSEGEVDESRGLLLHTHVGGAEGFIQNDGCYFEERSASPHNPHVLAVGGAAYNLDPEVYTTLDRVTCPSGECQPSGEFSFKLYGLAGFDLDTGGDYTEQSVVPPLLMDSFGAVVIRTWPTVAGLLKTVYNPADSPYTCLTDSVNRYVYDLDSGEVVDLLYSPTDHPVILNVTPCGMPAGNLCFWSGKVVGKVMLADSAPDLTANGITTFAYDTYPTDGLLYKLCACQVYLFLDDNNGNLKAFVSPLGPSDPPSLPNGDECTGDDSYYVPPAGFYKSQGDITSGNYFAHVSVLQTSPLKLKLTQTFMAMGVPDDGTGEDDCTRYILYPYLIEVYLDEPDIGII